MDQGEGGGKATIIVGLAIAVTAFGALGWLNFENRIRDTLGWEIGTAEERTEEAPPPMPGLTQGGSLETMVGSALDPRSAYSWTELQTAIDVCGLTPCMNGRMDRRIVAELRLALVRNGWYETTPGTPNAVWRHDGMGR